MRKKNTTFFDIIYLFIGNFRVVNDLLHRKRETVSVHSLYDQIDSENITKILTGFDDDVINEYDFIDLYRASQSMTAIHVVVYGCSNVYTIKIYYR